MNCPNCGTQNETDRKFCGECGTALALTGEPSPVEVTFTEPARYMRWSLPSLRRFVDMRPDLRVMLQGLVNRDLAQKLNTVIKDQNGAHERT